MPGPLRQARETLAREGHHERRLQKKRCETEGDRNFTCHRTRWLLSVRRMPYGLRESALWNCTLRPATSPFRMMCPDQKMAPAGGAVD